ncbi:MAG: phosphatase PAP2 family protein [Phycisphaerales bacterium]
MRSPPASDARDYNAPGAERRFSAPRAAKVVLGGLVLAAILLPLDPWAAGLAAKLQPGARWALGGDLKRELEFVQQFGAITSIVIVWVTVLLLDRPKRWLLPSFVAGSLLTSLVCNGFKMLLGRPRPKLGAPYELTPPWQTHPVPSAAGDVLRHGWETSQLWSFPSSHTAAAVVLAMFLSRMYPPLRPLAIGLAIVVATARVVLHAHYPSDVVGGATLGWLVAAAALDPRLGMRLCPPAWRPSQTQMREL